MNCVRKHPALRGILLLLLFLALLLPQAALASKSGAAKTEIRVLLTRLNLADEAWMTLEGRYLARCADGTEALLPAGARITVFLRDDRLVLFHEGLSLSAGKKLTLLRMQDGDSVPAIRFNLRSGSYPGDLTLTVKDGTIQPVLALPLETYLQGVLPYEMNDSFPAEALKAQAVCARTYALSRMDSQAAWDVTDNTNDQVFNGVPDQSEHTEQAVRDTAGLVLTSGKNLITAWYSASNGGQTELPGNVWGGSNIPPCFAMTDDPWDSGNPDSLTRTAVLEKNGSGLSAGLLRLLRAALEKDPELKDYRLSAEDPIRVDAIRNVQLTTPRFSAPSRLMTRLVITLDAAAALKPGAAVPTADPEDLDILEVLHPEWTELPAVTPAPEENNIPALVSTGTRTVTLDLFPDAVFMLGLSISGADNEIITVDEDTDRFILTSGRFGHGVGLSQRGAQYQASEGNRTFEEILDFYYPGAKLKRYEGETAPLPTPDPAMAETPGPVPTATPRPTLMPVTQPLPEGALLAYVENIDDDSTLNLREKPSPGARIILRLYKHQPLVILEESEVTGWVRVRTDAVEGYVMSSFLQIPE